MPPGCRLEFETRRAVRLGSHGNTLASDPWRAVWAGTAATHGSVSKSTDSPMTVRGRLRDAAVHTALLVLATCTLAHRALARQEHPHHVAPEPAPHPEPAVPERQHGHAVGDHEQHLLKALLGPYPPEREASGTSWVPDTSPKIGRASCRERG